ncbi:MAG: hypothetical protein MPJ24_00460 [Pirellulaceae bacterium]|nr:hypothetical protein [Pirellulaceae bacterium]
MNRSKGLNRQRFVRLLVLIVGLFLTISKVNAQGAPGGGWPGWEPGTTWQALTPAAYVYDDQSNALTSHLAQSIFLPAEILAKRMWSLDHLNGTNNYAPRDRSDAHYFDISLIRSHKTDVQATDITGALVLDEGGAPIVYSGWVVYVKFSNLQPRSQGHTPPWPDPYVSPKKYFIPNKTFENHREEGLESENLHWLLYWSPVTDQPIAIAPGPYMSATSLIVLGDSRDLLRECQRFLIDCETIFGRSSFQESLDVMAEIWGDSFFLYGRHDFWGK